MCFLILYIFEKQTSKTPLTYWTRVTEFQIIISCQEFLILWGRGCWHQWPSNRPLFSFSQMFLFLPWPEFCLPDQAGGNKSDTAMIWVLNLFLLFLRFEQNVTRCKQSLQAKEAGWIWPVDEFCWPGQCPCFSQEIVQNHCGWWLQPWN